MKYNHAFDIAFSIETEHDSANFEKIDDRVLYMAITERLYDLMVSGELKEAIGAPFDSYEVDE